MSNASLESSSHQRVERASERGNSADMASSAYGREASGHLSAKTTNTADQHLSPASISKDSISFGASNGCASGDHGLKVYDSMPVLNGPDVGNGFKIHDNMPISKGGDAANGVKVRDDMIVSNGSSDQVHKLPPGQESCAMGQGQQGNGADRTADKYRDSGALNPVQSSTDCSGTSFQSAHKDEHSEAPARHAHPSAHATHGEGQSHAHAHAHASHSEAHRHGHIHHEHHQTKHESGIGAHQSARGSGVAHNLDEKPVHCT
ncbi:MAG TPA: hypothetical protein V6D22_19315 [Candidatus Obscuribacterales bacterium]